MANTISARYYTDVDVFQRERNAIFARNWWLLGAAQQCSQPGQYLADVICGWPVVVVRSQDGVLRGFHNVCRHRGSTLVESGEGHCTGLRCPYHGWLYGTDGQLQKAPRFGELSATEQNALSLFPIQVAVWRGMLFVRPGSSQPTQLDAQAALMEWLGSLPALLDGMAGLDSMEYYGQFEVTGGANWKAYCDNTVEGYHLHSVHPRLARAVASGQVDIRSYDNGSLVAFHVTYGQAAGGAELRGDDGLWTYKFPGFQVAASNNAFKIERLEPCGVDRLRSINWAWYRDLSTEQRLDSFEWSRKVVEEDIGICEKVQINLAAGVYDHGPLSPTQEAHVAGLQQFYLQALNSD